MLRSAPGAVAAVATVLLAWPSAPSAQAAAELAERTLTIGVFDARPNVIVAPDGSVTGRVAQLLADLARAAGLEPRFQPLPLARLVAELQRGQIDMAPMPAAVEGTQTLVPLGRMFANDVAAIGRKGLRLDSVEDLAGLRVAARRGVQLDRFVPSRVAFSEVELNDHHQSLRMLTLGRIDALISACSVIEEVAQAARVARDDLGPILVLGQVDVNGYAAPALRGTPKLERLARAFRDLDWRMPERADAWCPVTARRGGGLKSRDGRERTS